MTAPKVKYQITFPQPNNQSPLTLGVMDCVEQPDGGFNVYGLGGNGSIQAMNFAAGTPQAQALQAARDKSDNFELQNFANQQP